MWKVELSSPKGGKRTPYRQYSPTDMLEAYNAVKNDKMPVCRAGKQFNVPESSLRDRVLGLVSIEACKSGSQTLFTIEQEKYLANHFKNAASNGYQYGRSEMINIASEFAVYLGLRDRDNNLSNKWYSTFLQRWPELRLDKPRMSTGKRTFTGFSKPAVERIEKQEKELGEIIAKFQFKEKPERIYHVDDKMLYVPVARTPHVISTKTKGEEQQQDHRIISLIGCGNAVGNHIPPYYVFSGDKMKSVCLKEKTPGATGGKSEDGKMNEEVFLKYLQEHFIKFIPNRSADNPVLLLCDSNKDYISSDVIEWAEKENIIFLLIISPDDEEISCFGTFDKIFEGECSKFTKGKSSRIITELHVCRLACKSYITALSAENLHRMFNNTGLFPYKPAIKSLKTKSLDFIMDKTVDNSIEDVNDAAGASGINTLLQEPNNTSVDHPTSKIGSSTNEHKTENNDGDEANDIFPEHNYGVRLVTQECQTKTPKKIVIDVDEISHGNKTVAETLPENNGDNAKDTVNVDKNYAQFFSNIEKILFENFKEGKSKKEKVSFVYYKDANAIEETEDGSPSVTKKCKYVHVDETNK